MKTLVITNDYNRKAFVEQRLERIYKTKNQHKKYYSVQPIMEFIRKYASAYYVGDQSCFNDSRVVTQIAKRLFALHAVKRTVEYSYAGLVIDKCDLEYTEGQKEILNIFKTFMKLKKIKT